MEVVLETCGEAIKKMVPVFKPREIRKYGLTSDVEKQKGRETGSGGI